jgi:hypothetical protein
MTPLQQEVLTPRPAPCADYRVDSTTAHMIWALLVLAVLRIVAEMCL